MAVLCLALTACESRSTKLRLTEVVGPEGGDVLTVAQVGNDVVGLSEVGAFRWQDGSWTRQPGFGLAQVDSRAALQALARSTAQLNYPRSNLVAQHGDGIWMVSELNGAPALLWSDSAGARWSQIALPLLHGKTEAEDATATVRTNEPPRLATTATEIFLVGTENIWRFGGRPEAPSWVSVGLDGLPTSADGLPPAIRNYLPRTAVRPFEMVTILTDQLLVFRRSEQDEPWMLTSTMAVVDREIRGTPGSDAVFVVSPESIRRTDDQGERWFGFWPAGYPRIEAFAVRADPKLDAGYDLIVGAANGSIWVSHDAGATWLQTRPADPDGRSISSIALGSDGIWASTLGHGVLHSSDGGQSWVARNPGLRAALPLGIEYSRDGELLMASRRGLMRLAGEPDSGNWTLINDRATSAVAVDPLSNRIVAGSISGALTTLSQDDEPTTVRPPFAGSVGVDFSPKHLAGALTPAAAILVIVPRDDGRQWLAWSHQSGAAVSDDGGASWRLLALSDALHTALLSTTVTQVVAEPNDTIYLVDANSDSRSPALIWRSEDDGTSWTTVHAVVRNRGSDVIVRPRHTNYPGVIFAANGDSLARSADAGVTWTDLAGPWTGNRIVALAMQEQSAALLLDSRDKLELVRLTNLDAETPTSSRHEITSSRLVKPDDVRNFALHGQRLVLTAGKDTWTGVLPERRAGFRGGLAVAATLLGALSLIAAAFAYMRVALAK